MPALESRIGMIMTLGLFFRFFCAAGLCCIVVGGELFELESNVNDSSLMG